MGVVGTNEPMTRFGLQARAFVLMDGKASGFQRDKCLSCPFGLSARPEIFGRVAAV